jgi:hypothetical protein
MPNPAALARQALTQTLLFVAAIVLLFEEWLWDRGTYVLARLGRRPFVHAIEGWARDRPPPQALALFAVPVAVVYPCKLVALLALGAGYVAIGALAFVAAKIVATALFARLYQLTEPALMTYGCLRRGRDRFLRARRFVHHWLNLRPFYRQARYRVCMHSARLSRRYRAVYRLQHQRRRSRVGALADARR